MLQLSVLRWGQPYQSLDIDQVVHFQTGEPIAKVGRANGGLIQRDMRKAARARDVAARDSDRGTDRARRQGRRALRERGAADRRRQPDARRVRPRAVGIDRHPRAAVPREHEEEHLRARRDAADSRVAHPRPRSRRADAGLRRRARRPDQLAGRKPGPRPRAAVELTRRSHAVAAGHPDADRTGPQAGPAGAMDAVPDGGGVLRRGYSARGDFHLPRRGRRRRRGARGVRAQPDLRRHGDGRPLPRQPARAGARPGVLEDPARRRSGGQLGEAPRRDGRQRVREQRARLHQLLGDLGEPSRPADRGGARPTDGQRSSAAARGSRGEPRRVHRAGERRVDLQRHRRRPEGRRA